MQSKIHFIDELLSNVGNFLRSIDYTSYFLIIPLALLAILCIVRLISNALTILTPIVFGHDHRKALYRNGRICLLFSLAIQILYWLWGSEMQKQLLCHADYFASGALAGTAVLGLLAGGFQMLFRRKGTRVFTMKNLSASGLSLLAIAAALALFGWFFLGQAT